MEQGGGSGKKQLRVTIYNQTYTVAATEDPIETEQTAQLVHDVMCAIAARAGNLDTARIAVLAGLHLADRLRIAERELDTLRTRADQVDQKARNISDLLDSFLDPA